MRIANKQESDMKISICPFCLNDKEEAHTLCCGEVGHIEHTHTCDVCEQLTDNPKPHPSDDNLEVCEDCDYSEGERISGLQQERENEIRF